MPVGQPWPNAQAPPAPGFWLTASPCPPSSPGYGELRVVASAPIGRNGAPPLWRACGPRIASRFRHPSMKATLIHNPGAGDDKQATIGQVVALLEEAGYKVRFQSSK